MFVAKLNPASVYCTYIGGRSDDRAFGIAVDAGGNVLVTGWTASAAFLRVRPVQSSLAGGKDAFVAKLNATGNSLVYGAYLGGNGQDSGTGIAVDAAGNAYLTGSTSSLNFPVQNAFQNGATAQGMRSSPSGLRLAGWFTARIWAATVMIAPRVSPSTLLEIRTSRVARPPPIFRYLQLCNR